MNYYPQDSDQKQKERECVKQLYMRLESKYWEVRNTSGQDVGIDMIIEFIDNMEVRGDKIDLQLKSSGRENIILKEKNTISYSISTMTLKYALNSSKFFLFLIYSSVKDEMYYFDIRDLDEKEKTKIDKQKTLNLHFDFKNKIDKLNDINFLKDEFFIWLMSNWCQKVCKSWE